MSFKMNTRKLEYVIHNFSSFSATYLPENIREDDPKNQTCRWSSNTNNPPQFLTLKLHKPSIVRYIKFGKYEKSHVCNLKKFRIMGGLEENTMIQIYEGGLRNDSHPETFEVKHMTISGDLYPILYLQIIPLLSWGPSFNFSIWYIEVIGNDEEIFVLNSLENYNLAREVEILRLCLKHFRQRGYEKTFRELENETNITLEDLPIKDFHYTLVDRGDYKESEKMIEKFIDGGFTDWYIAKQKYKPVWKEIEERNDVEVSNRPRKRGGHQMVLDTTNDVIYLYGGWDCVNDLTDLWTYDIATDKWHLIHERSEDHGGPTPRACHKMVYDTKTSQIFVLGRYINNNSPKIKECYKSDFYLYDTRRQSWLLICDNTSQENGPKLIYDHQMCIDVEQRMIYVFGGKISHQKNGDQEYSGLYSYHIDTNTWNVMLVDCGDPIACNPEISYIKSRGAHSMVFHQKNRKLYVYGGQRGKEYLTDLLQIDVDSLEVKQLQATSGLELANDQDPIRSGSTGYTQRSSIDENKNEIYFLASMSRDKDKRDVNGNSLWMYSLLTNEWSCIYRTNSTPENTIPECDLKRKLILKQPCPRYAHQFIYNPKSSTFYLYGGNPGGAGGSSPVRLDDFWKLELSKPSRLNVLNYCKYLIRKQEYEEITKKDPIKGVWYLQNKLSETIDKQDDNQLTEFHKLASLLFRSSESNVTNSTIDEMYGTDNNETNNEFMDNMANCQNSNTLIDTSELASHSAMLGLEGAVGNECMSPVSDLKTIENIKRSGNQTNLKFKVDQNKIRNQRSILFNKLVELLPEANCQPRKSLSDFIMI